MSPKKASSNTLRDRLSFRDADLTTPQHDAIMVWLDKSLRDYEIRVPQEELTRSCVITDDSRNTSRRVDAADFTLALESAFGMDEALERMKAANTKGRDAADAAYSQELIWEYAIPAKNGAAGFIDLLYTATVPTSMYFELVHTRDGKSDLYAGVSKHTSRDAMEVKSSIPSLGEIVREIRYYESLLPWCTCPYRYGQKDHESHLGIHDKPFFTVVSPDTRWAEQLRAQGIAFVEAPADLLEGSA